MKKLLLLVITTLYFCYSYAQVPDEKEDPDYFKETTIVETSICTDIYSYYNPETKEFTAPEGEDEKKQQEECVEQVKICEGDMFCIDELAPGLSELIRKRLSKPGGKPISDDIYRIIKKLLKGLVIQVKMQKSSGVTIMIGGNGKNWLYKRDLKKSSKGSFVSPGLYSASLNTALIKLYNKKPTVTNKKAALKNLFRGMSFKVRLEIKE